MTTDHDDFDTHLADLRARARVGRLPEDARAAETDTLAAVAAQHYMAAVAGGESLETQIRWARRAVHLGRGKVRWTSLCKAGRLHPRTLFARERQDLAACLPDHDLTSHPAMQGDGRGGDAERMARIRPGRGPIEGAA